MSATGRYRAKIHASMKAVALLAALAAALPAHAQVRRVEEVRVGAELSGPILRATVQSQDVSWIATQRELWQFSRGRLHLADSAAYDVTKIVVAPGGGRYLRLVAGQAPFGLFVADVLDTSDRSRVLARLQSADYPFGFSAIHVARNGNLFVTVTPVDDAEGLRGRFTYRFWSRDGQLTGESSIEGPRMGALDESGGAILLYGEKGADSVRPDGTRLWNLDGPYRKGVIASGGRIALLNPADDIEQLHLIRAGSVTAVNFDSPVHELAITPDGAMAAVATDAGRVSLFRTTGCDAHACSRFELPPLPAGGRVYVSSLRFVDRDLIAVAALGVSGSRPNERIEDGYLFLFTTNGQVEYRKKIALPQPATWSPLLDAGYRQAKFTVYTRDSASIVPARR